MLTNHILILQNKSNSGKTKTLKLLADILIAKGGNTRILKGKLEEKHNFVIEIIYQGRTIIIISMGDNHELEEEYSLSFRESNDIDIIFGASRTSGITTRIIKKYATEKNFNIIWTSSYQYRDKKNVNEKQIQNTLNNTRAQELFNLI